MGASGITRRTMYAWIATYPTCSDNHVSARGRFSAKRREFFSSVLSSHLHPRRENQCHDGNCFKALLQ